PAKMLRKNFIYEVAPSYQYDGQSVDLENVEFDATQYSKEEQPRKTEEYSFAYDPSMRNGQLVVQGIGRKPDSDNQQTTDELPVARGVITTSKLVKDSYYAAYAPHGYNTDEELEPIVLNFFFPQGVSTLRTTEIRSERGDSLEAFIANKNVTRTVTITGTHSPEGPERINENLAEERASAIEEYYRNMMDRYDYDTTAIDIEFILKPVVEDWGLFREKLVAYDGITEEQKQEYYNIIDDAGMSFEEKEDAMHQLDTYRQVFRDVYPELRRAHTEILKVMDKKSEAEISVLSKQISEGAVSADSLSAEELAYGATLTPSLDEKEDIYKSLVEKNDSWIAHTNLGAVYLEKAFASNEEAMMNDYLEQAATQFEIAMRQQPNAAAAINMAIVSALQGNMGQAYDYITQAEELNPESENVKSLSGVKGIVEIKRAMYTDAVQSLTNAETTSDNLFNLGLAYLLAEDTQNAMTTFEEAIEANSDNALAYYGAAIAAANMNNAEKMAEMLSKAVDLDPDMADFAMNDLEFAEYAETQAFKDALM
ncbi:MAG: tetratricopeptide repeat protein, partial [Cyclobacteriaceae bacterium]